MLKLIAFVIFLPEELSFYILDFRLSPIRLVLFALTPVLLIYFSQLLASGKRRLVFSDIMFVLTGIWMIVSPAMVVDLSYSLHHSAPIAAEFCGSYLAARVLLSERKQAVNFVNLMCHVIAVVALTGVLDALTSRPAIHEFLRDLTGYVQTYQDEFRLGVFRAMGPIEHPILFGMVCCLGLLLAITSPIRGKSVTIAVCSLGVLVSLSSAPIQGVVLGLGLLAYDRTFARYRNRWSFLIGVGAIGIGVSYAFTSSPLNFVSRYVLDPQTFWIRWYQWSVVGPIVLNSPWVGVGFEWSKMALQLPYFEHLPSIDTVWLNLALIYGLPGSILVGLSMLSAICSRCANLTIDESKLATTLGVIISVVVLLGFTVDFWGSAWMLVGLLVGVSARLAELAFNPAVWRLRRNALAN